MAQRPYSALSEKLSRRRLVVLDGGTGTDIQRRGVPMHGQTWCAEANMTHPDIVREVHVDYIRAGAEVVTANTFATSPLLFDALGRGREIAAFDHAAITLAREARDAVGRSEIAIGGSFSTMRLVEAGSDRTGSRNWSRAEAAPLMRAKAEGLAEAGADLIIMEMMRDGDYASWATEAAIATGLPVWIGISLESKATGQLAGYSRPDQSAETIFAALCSLEADAILIMHTAVHDTDAALPILAKHWKGPVGAYPESGYFKMPDWQFVDTIEPQALVDVSLNWRRHNGATILGGCCGIGPDHIRALAAARETFDDVSIATPIT